MNSTGNSYSQQSRERLDSLAVCPTFRGESWTTAEISQVPNPSLALQASIAREVSFSNGASTAGGSTDLKLEEEVAGFRSLGKAPTDVRLPRSRPNGSNLEPSSEEQTGLKHSP